MMHYRLAVALQKERLRHASRMPKRLARTQSESAGTRRSWLPRLLRTGQKPLDDLSTAGSYVPKTN